MPRKANTVARLFEGRRICRMITIYEQVLGNLLKINREEEKKKKQVRIFIQKRVINF